MKISIITVVRNNASTIKDTIDSVLKQTYSNVEYIVIDGSSTDGTIEIIQGYKKYIKKFISEKDKGVYDAMNKGINLATGDVIGLLNGDDVYFDETVLQNVANAFKKNESDCVYGDLYYVARNNLDEIVRYWKSSKFKKGSFARGWHPPHPTFFLKKEVYSKYGLYDIEMKVSADFDLMLRLLEKYNITSHYLPTILVRMRTGGMSNKTIKNIIISNQSILRSFDKYKIKINKFMYLIYRLLPKVMQMIRK
jgi:glycosyltransferase involved in cell wall biosynthesis